MSYNPNHLLNTPLPLGLANPALIQGAREEAAAAPAAPPPFDRDMYLNAYGRLGMLSIENVADLGCGAGNFAAIMRDRNQLPERYLGVDSSHSQISLAKRAYPGWKFIYGDFTQERIRAEYERFGALLMLNLLDTMENDLEFLMSLPQDKPMVFSIPRFEREGSLFYLAEGRDIHDRYSSILNLKSIGRYRNARGEAWSMVIASR
jgi:SAM-dependent methyltransferase